MKEKSKFSDSRLTVFALKDLLSVLISGGAGILIYNLLYPDIIFDMELLGLLKYKLMIYSGIFTYVVIFYLARWFHAGFSGHWNLDLRSYSAASVIYWAPVFLGINTVTKFEKFKVLIIIYFIILVLLGTLSEMGLTILSRKKKGCLEIKNPAAFLVVFPVFLVLCCPFLIASGLTYFAEISAELAFLWLVLAVAAGFASWLAKDKSMGKT